jgi:8-oxo-dGTP diphosphatase
VIPRYGRPPEPRGYRLRPGIYAILPRDGLVLLTHQDGPVPEFQLPGGGIDPGEQPLPALVREVREETGWSIAKPRRVGAYRRFTFMPDYGFWAEKLCHVYLAHPARRLGRPSEPGHEAVWVDFASAMELLASEGDRILLKACLGQPSGRYSSITPETSSPSAVLPAKR